MQILSVIGFVVVFLFFARIQFRILLFNLLSCLRILLQFEIIPQSLSFLTCSVLKHTGQLFCKMSLSLGMSDVSHQESVFLTESLLVKPALHI